MDKKKKLTLDLNLGTYKKAKMNTGSKDQGPMDMPDKGKYEKATMKSGSLGEGELEQVKDRIKKTKRYREAIQKMMKK